MMWRPHGSSAFQTPPRSRGARRAVADRLLGFLPTAASAAPVTTSATQAADAGTLAYVVNTKVDHRTIKSVKKAIAAAGGTVVAAYDRIGVLVVHSANPDFGAAIRAVRGVQSAGATRTAPLSPAWTTDEGAAQVLSKAEAAKVAKASGAAGPSEPLEADQWDLRAIGADKAALINPGSKKVTVAVIDTGVDDTHPDLAPNFSAAQSANCVGGVADTSAGAWRPYTADDYHGTHVAGEIAAARNGIGVAGVAPGVKVMRHQGERPQGRPLLPGERRLRLRVRRRPRRRDHEQQLLR